jgi:hypothetical protein
MRRGRADEPGEGCIAWPIDSPVNKRQRLNHRDSSCCAPEQPRGSQRVCGRADSPTHRCAAPSRGAGRRRFGDAGSRLRARRGGRMAAPARRCTGRAGGWRRLRARTGHRGTPALVPARRSGADHRRGRPHDRVRDGIPTGNDAVAAIIGGFHLSGPMFERIIQADGRRARRALTRTAGGSALAALAPDLHIAPRGALDRPSGGPRRLQRRRGPRLRRRS